MLELKSKQKSFGINFPTELSEITPEVLESITAGVKLPKHYCIVALAFRTKLFDFVTSMKNNVNNNVAVTPILAKVAEGCEQDVNACIGDRLIIDRSSLERSVHLNLPTMINSGNAAAYITDDKELVKNITNGTYNSNGTSAKVFILEFKIVPITFISAAVHVKQTIVDPFKTKEVN